MKKLTAMLLAVILVFSVTACSNEKEEKKEKSKESESEFTSEEFDTSNSKVRTFANYLSDNNYNDAIEQYNEEIVGNAEYEIEAAECVKVFMENTAKGVLSGTYTKNDAKARMTTVGKIYEATNCEITEYDVLTENVEQALDSKVAYESGVSLLTSQNYIDAIAEFDKVLESDCNYSDAMQQRTTAIDSYKTKVIGDADACVTANDYPGAIDMLKKAVANLPEDSELLAKLNTCEKNFVAKAVSDSEAAFTDYAKYEDAAAIILSALQYYPEDQTLIEKRDYYNSFIPVNLYDLNPVKGELYKETTEIDTYNNEHTKCFYISSGSSYYVNEAVYDLDAQYNKFFSTIYSRSSAVEASIYSLVIKGDGKILYENYNIADNGRPFDIEVNITGVTELTVTMGRVDSYSGNGYGMTNTIVQRTEK